MRSLHNNILAIMALTLVPGLKTIAKAQSLGGLPDCAKPALLAAFQASGCKATDADCLCSNPNLLTSLQSFVEDACSPADQDAVIVFGQNFCGTTGTPVPGDMPEPGPMDATAIPKTPSMTTLSITMSETATTTGGAVETGISAAALAVAVGGMGWFFAEL